ncbi:DUF2182 domain-containing protein [Cohaesibacter gelatinilyticus]|uniref:Predicted metal-binding membrane protein n=1 Tax=Cohaesibacter gelatinilyticus TaxID=372072 RepID=A0A285NDS1_9HYPH|nr:DUF2182 domain-containing protein [Cohaesibacter gelatinilyticus]SNZ07642.1 Predicted metal-binding membrane protein [Cohaesibacter gelatinilyticus]
MMGKIFNQADIEGQELFNQDAALVAASGKPRIMLVLFIAIASLFAWTYLFAMVVDMAPDMDMRAMGPGMDAFNIFNSFGNLDPTTRAFIAAVCAPSAAIGHFGMPSFGAWGFEDLTIVFAMWSMMAIAMMLPTAAPILKSYANFQEAKGNKITAFSVLLLALGYLTIWIGFGLLATLVQWGLTEAQTMSPVMAPASMVFSASILVLAGIYQFTPAKLACLIRCQLPFPYFNRRSKQGFFQSFTGSYVMGLEQGIFCLGCTWAIMAVMFAVGVMNVIWMAILGVLMGIEKMVPNIWVTRGIGIFLIVWGLLIFTISDAGRTLLGIG